MIQSFRSKGNGLSGSHASFHYVPSFLYTRRSSKYAVISVNEVNTVLLFEDVNAILQQALGRSPAYGSIRDVLQSFVADQVND